MIQGTDDRGASDDRDRILDLVRRYFDLLDNGDPAELKPALFTPGGRLIVSGADVFAGGSEARQNAGLPEEPIVGHTHCLHQAQIVLDGDRAFGEIYATAHVMVEGDGGRRLLVRSIRYFDRYLRQAGDWRIDERRHHVHWMYEVPLELAVARSERAMFGAFLAEHGHAS